MGILLTAVGFAFVAASASADYFWDVNDTGEGAADDNAPSGDWDGGNAFWNSDSTGGGAGSFVVDPGTGDRGVLSAGSDATGSSVRSVRPPRRGSYTRSPSIAPSAIRVPSGDTVYER